MLRGRQASLAHLAAVLRGVEIVEANRGGVVTFHTFERDEGDTEADGNADADAERRGRRQT